MPCCNNNAAARPVEKLADEPKPAPTGSCEVTYSFKEGKHLKDKNISLFVQFFFIMLSTQQEFC